MNVQKIIRGGMAIDVMETDQGFTYRAAHCMTPAANELFPTADEAADAAATIWEVMTSLGGQPMTNERYLQLCDAFGVAPLTRFGYTEDHFAISVYGQGAQAVVYKLHQLRCWEIKREVAARRDAAAEQAAQLRVLEIHAAVAADEEAACVDL